ncbi:MAG: hypothetical protein ACREQL_00735, partial [Candidatus Binatia bacterium]
MTRTRMAGRLAVSAVGFAVGVLVLVDPLRAVGEERKDALRRSGVARGGVDRDVDASARRLVDEGRQIFRHDTFGDEAFWGGQLRL